MNEMPYSCGNLKDCQATHGVDFLLPTCFENPLEDSIWLCGYLVL
jgi:hypothetical protein